MDLYLKKCLDNAGWYKNRKIEVEYMLGELLKMGYSITGFYVKNFLQEFGNLLIEFETPDKKISNVRINYEAAQELYPEETSKLSDFINDQIIPIGYIHFETALLLISDKTGKFYMSIDAGFYSLGNNFTETLESIIYKRNVMKITLSPPQG
jgi:hypothetical protein